MAAKFGGGSIYARAQYVHLQFGADSPSIPPGSVSSVPPLPDAPAALGRDIVS